jgi:FkbM family methyltransferase
MATDIVGTSGQVFSIEPNIGLYQRLRASARQNSFDHWHVVPAGVGAESSLGKLHIQRSSGISFIGEKAREDDKVVDVQITPVLTLDEIIASLCPDTQPKLVKIDVEGLELKVLEGAGALLRERQARFVIEHSQGNQARFGIGVEDIAEFFEEFGYKPVPISSEKIDFRCSDILWCPKE